MCLGGVSVFGIQWQAFSHEKLKLFQNGIQDVVLRGKKVRIFGFCGEGFSGKTAESKIRLAPSTFLRLSSLHEALSSAGSCSFAISNLPGSWEYFSRGSAEFSAIGCFVLLWCLSAAGPPLVGDSDCCVDGYLSGACDHSGQWRVLDSGRDPYYRARIHCYLVYREIAFGEKHRSFARRISCGGAHFPSGYQWCGMDRQSALCQKLDRPLAIALDRPCRQWYSYLGFPAQYGCCKPAFHHDLCIGAICAA